MCPRISGDGRSMEKTKMCKMKFFIFLLMDQIFEGKKLGAPCVAVSNQDASHKHTFLFEGKICSDYACHF